MKMAWSVGCAPPTPSLRANPDRHRWGGFALHAAARYGCRITTTTLSREQYEHVLDKVLEAGLTTRVTVLLKQYDTFFRVNVTSAWPRCSSSGPDEDAGPTAQDALPKGTV